MSAIMQNLALLSAFACLLLSIHLLTPRASRAMSSILLGTTFLTLALQSLMMISVLEFGRGLWAIPLPSSALLIGPLLFMYFESLADTHYRVTRVRYLHFLPALFCLGEMMAGVFYLDPDLMIVLSFAVYSLALLWRSIGGRRQFSHFGPHQNIVFLWLILSVVMLAVSSLNEIFILYELQQGKSINSSVALLTGFVSKLTMLSFTLLSALRSPSLLNGLISVRHKANLPVSQSANDNMYRALASKFDAIVQEEKLYAQDNVSLKNVAILLDVQQRQLSQAINYVHQESFSKRMNRLRINEAKKLLADPSGKSIVDVMLDSGFRTKSNFNREFLAIEGMSPSDYRQENS